MSNFENYDFILPDGVVIENEKADKNVCYVCKGS